jgi:hypothetical protein
MAWIALGLLVFSIFLVGLNTIGGRWSMHNWRSPRRGGFTFDEWADVTEVMGLRASLPGSAADAGLTQAIMASCRAAMRNSEFFVFANWFVFPIFVSFLLPIWCLSFSTEALGGEREGSSLLWLLTKPLSRPAIYLAKYLALLPWSLGLAMGGFALLCVAAGKPGWLALERFWPAVFCGTLAFSALYHLMGAFFKRPAIIALVYSFFLETLLGNMPGYLKRASIGFYTRCMMFDAAQDIGVEPEKPSVYLAVNGTTACWVLLGASVVLLLTGMLLFSRSEYVAAD